MASKWYVVWEGYEPGVYTSWDECRRNIEGYKGAKFKSFKTQTQAMRAFEDGYTLYNKLNPEGSGAITLFQDGHMPISNALSVDAGCLGNPGILEYRGVMVDTHREVFRVGPFPKGTNNIGEFLAIVHGLSLLKKHNLNIPLYTDSMTAIAWVRNRKCKTLLPRDTQTEHLLDLVRRAEVWLQDNTYSTVILKWDTVHWGEIPADFGRK